MIPVENSIAGRVADIHHLLPESGLHIVGEYFMPIHFQLMAVPGARAWSRSRPCAATPTRSGSAAGSCASTAGTRVVADDTAGAAREVAELGRPARSPRSSPRLAAEIYGLEILAEDVEDEHHNTTRFLVLAREPREPAPRRRPGHHELRLPRAQRAGRALQGDGRVRDQRRQHDQARELPARRHLLRDPVLRRRRGPPEGRVASPSRWRSSPSSRPTCGSSAPTRPAPSAPRSRSPRRTGSCAPATVRISPDDATRPAWVSRPRRGYSQDVPPQPAAADDDDPPRRPSRGRRSRRRQPAVAPARLAAAGPALRRLRRRRSGFGSSAAC